MMCTRDRLQCSDARKGLMRNTYSAAAGEVGRPGSYSAWGSNFAATGCAYACPRWPPPVDSPARMGRLEIIIFFSKIIVNFIALPWEPYGSGAAGEVASDWLAFPQAGRSAVVAVAVA